MRTGSLMRACPRYAPTCASTCARACVCDRAHTYSALKRMSTIRRCRPRAARLAGVRLVGVQREHRRMEHRLCHLVVLCMRHFRPVARHAADALGQCSMGHGRRARRRHRCVRACAHLHICMHVKSCDVNVYACMLLFRRYIHVRSRA
jgi:hypothetical protein